MLCWAGRCHGGTRPTPQFMDYRTLAHPQRAPRAPERSSEQEARPVGLWSGRACGLGAAPVDGDALRRPLTADPQTRLVMRTSSTRLARFSLSALPAIPRGFPATIRAAASEAVARGSTTARTVRRRPHRLTFARGVPVRAPPLVRRVCAVFTGGAQPVGHSPVPGWAPYLTRRVLPLIACSRPEHVARTRTGGDHSGPGGGQNMASGARTSICQHDPPVVTPRTGTRLFHSEKNAPFSELFS